MNTNPEVVDMIGKIITVNAVAILLLAVMSYVAAVLMLEGLAALDRWLDRSQRAGQKGSVFKSFNRHG